MTRITNFGRKRRYLEAGFVTDQTATSNDLPTSDVNSAIDASQGDAAHLKKKQKKTKKRNAEGDGDERTTTDGIRTRGKTDAERRQKRSKMAKELVANRAKSVAISGFKKRTEQRRLKRMLDRQADTVCFACREKGHAAKDCPGAAGKGQKDPTSTMRICYRCGSTQHTLSHCKKPEDPLDRFPFASCFICSGKGHLVSSCPQNKDKGIYPNGGSCKLCGENMHLAKDCELRKKDVSGTAATSIFGIGSGAGADEDDFHTFKRKNAEVTKDEKEYRRRERVDAKAAVQVAASKTSSKNQMSSKPKKVVFF